MKPIAIFTALLMIVMNALGTAQDPEKLEYNGEVVDLYSEPLESKLENLQSIYGDRYRASGSGNWRGYIGHWKIKNKTLYLTDVQARGLRRLHSDESDFFAGEVEFFSGTIPLKDILSIEESYPVKADWYCGTLRIPRGEVAQYVHMGYGSRFEEELYIQIKDGKVVKEYSIKYDPVKDAFRSLADMQWVALGELTAALDDGSQWIDGRLLHTSSIAPLIESKKAFRTRGILFLDDKLPHLWIPGTAKTESTSLPMNKLAKPRIPEGSHVEIECSFYKMEDGIGLAVSSMRELKPGETMHHPQFPEIWKKIEAATEAPKPTDNAEQE